MSQTSPSLTLPVEIERRLPGEVVSALIDFQQRLLSLFPGQIERLILYGSYPRGEATPESDVDVMVVVRWPSPQQVGAYYLGGPGDPRWQQIVDLAMDIMIAHGP